MISVALLERQPRVAARQALGLGLRERDHSTYVVTYLVLMERSRAAGSDVPTQIRPERRSEQHHRYSADLVAVAVHPRQQHLDHALDRRLNFGRHPRAT